MGWVLRIGGSDGVGLRREKGKAGRRGNLRSRTGIGKWKSENNG